MEDPVDDPASWGLGKRKFPVGAFPRAALPVARERDARIPPLVGPRPNSKRQCVAFDWRRTSCTRRPHPLSFAPTASFETTLRPRGGSLRQRVPRPAKRSVHGDPPAGRNPNPFFLLDAGVRTRRTICNRWGQEVSRRA